MSSSSRSSKGNHYRQGNNGSNHYQKKGVFGKIFDGFGSGSGSGSGSNRNYNQNQNQNQNNNNNTPMNNQPLANQNSMTCSKCNSKVPVGSKFCLQCGEKVSEVLFCMECGEKLPSNAKFCLKCGKGINQ
jgi:ribosomal protein L40E